MKSLIMFLSCLAISAISSAQQNPSNIQVDAGPSISKAFGDKNARSTFRGLDIIIQNKKSGLYIPISIQSVTGASYIEAGFGYRAHLQKFDLAIAAALANIKTDFKFQTAPANKDFLRAKIQSEISYQLLTRFSISAKVTVDAKNMAQDWYYDMILNQDTPTDYNPRLVDLGLSLKYKLFNK